MLRIFKNWFTFDSAIQKLKGVHFFETGHRMLVLWLL